MNITLNINFDLLNKNNKIINIPICGTILNSDTLKHIFNNNYNLIPN